MLVQWSEALEATVKEPPEKPTKAKKVLNVAKGLVQTKLKRRKGENLMPAKARKKTQEEDTISTIPEVDKRYIAEIVLVREPLDKNIPAGIFVYRDSTGSFTFEDRNPGCEADIETLMEGDLSISDELGGTTFISVNESPKEWVINSVLSNEFSGNPYGIERVYNLDEAE